MALLRPRILAPVLLPLLALLAPWTAAGDAAAPGPVLLVSQTALSPDGGILVFAWRGDLWRVASTGGRADRLTFHPAVDARPRVAPDGKTLAFISNRSGSDQVWQMPLGGGRPRRLTEHTEGYDLDDWFPGGKALLVEARRDHDWRDAGRFFRRPLDRDAPSELLFDAYGSAAQLSPDGKRIAFTREGVAWWRKGYEGSQASQVWIYDVETKTFTKITQHEGGERSPLWAPDGTHLYVTSQESGTFNLWSVDLEGGTRVQLTFFEDDGVLFPTISDDGSVLVFRRLFDLWRFEPSSGMAPTPIAITDGADTDVEPVLRRTLDKATEVAFTDDAREMAFIAGGDVWVMDTELREPKRVTDTPEEERDPVFSPDFEALYFVSDAGGQPDVWKASRLDPKQWWWQNDAFGLERITNDHVAERWLGFTPDGKRLSLLKGRGDVMTMNPDGTDAVVHLSSWNEPSWTFSPDGQWIAYAVSDAEFNEDVWIRRTDGTGEPFNVSRHPDWDGAPYWSPDGRILAFASRRWRDEQDLAYVWLRKTDEEESRRDRTLEKALEKMKGRKKKGPKAAPRPVAESADAAPSDPVAGTWSGRILGDPPVPPDGLALTLVVARGEGGAITASVDVGGMFQGSVSSITYDAASRRVAFSLTTPLGPLAGDGTIDGRRLEGTWTLGAVGSGTFALERAEAEAPAEEGEAGGATKKPDEKAGPEPVAIDFDGLEDRIHRIAIPHSSEGRLLWSPDGKKLAFEATVNGSRGLYTVTFPDDLSPKRLTPTVGSSATWLKTANQIAWLVAGTPATLTPSGKGASYGFRANQEVDLGARHAAAFDQAWRVMRDTFYDARMNNRDWDAVRAKYRPLAAKARRPQDLEQIVDMMLGELNASHMGFSASSSRWSAPGWHEVTGHLGTRFDPTWPGPGLRVRDVVPGTPAAQAKHRIDKGEIVLAIDGHEVGPSTSLARVLTGLPDREVHVRVRNTAGDERDVVLRPTSYGAIRAHLYDEVLEERRAEVEERSGGRLGYLHVRGMSWPSFERFEAELYKVGHGKDGLVIDVRDNGGGFTADHLLTVLTQPRHAITVSRGGGPGYPQDRMVYARWWKPIVVLCNQNSFSNAEIFAHAIKTLRRGPVVGVPTAGGVISTGGTSIMDVGSLRLPGRGWFLLDSGEDMEHNGCVPDHIVWPAPGEMPTGVDRQLEKAVEVLQEEVREAGRRAAPTPRYASER